jgi:hypothetical protein
LPDLEAIANFRLVNDEAALGRNFNFLAQSANVNVDVLAACNFFIAPDLG